MALSDVEIVTTVIVLGILLLVILYNNVRAARAKPAAAKESEGEAPPVHPLLVKFARHEGNVVGESVAIDGGNLILKQAGQFKSVPLSQAKEQDGEIVLSGAIDWDAAKAAGAAWHTKNRAAVDDAVSGPLTRSEDVKSPALDSVNKREG